MLIVMFKPEYAENMNNPLVNVLIIIFACIYAILSGINIARAFSDSERINSILLFKGKDSATKASISVVKKTAKVATAQIEGAKLKKAILLVDENNDVKMKVDLKINDDDVDKIINSVRANIITTFDEVLGFRFKSIDFSVVNLKNPQYIPNPEMIKAEKDKYLKEQNAIKAAEEAKRLATSTEEETPVVDAITTEDIQSIVTQEILTEGEAPEVITASLEEDDVTPPGAAIVIENLEPPVDEATLTEDALESPISTDDAEIISEDSDIAAPTATDEG